MTLLNEGQEIMIVIAIVVAMVILSYGLFMSIKHEKKRHSKEKMIGEGVLDFEAFGYFLTQRIKDGKYNVHYTLAHISFDNLNTFESQLDKSDMHDFLDQRAHIMLRNLPYGSKVCIQSKEKELYIFLPNIYDKQTLETLLENVKKSIEQSYVLFEELTIEPVSTISYAFYPDHGNTDEQLFNALHIASYHAGRSGGNTIKAYAPEMAKNQQYVEQYYQLKEAIKKKEFRFDYQPIIDISNKSIYGAEALLRWNHPTRGVLGPQQFMQLLEASGDIDWISLWGLETAIKAIDAYKRETGAESFKAHVNLSPRQLMNENIVITFQNLITRLRFPASDIILELLDFEEHVLNQQFIKTMIRLQSIGFLIAVDLNEVSYQTLALIEKHHIKVIKMTRKFMVSEQTDMKNKLIKDLLDLAEKQKRIIIAEGIEEKEQADQLMKQNIKYVQGFLYARPMDETKFRAFKLK